MQHRCLLLQRRNEKTKKRKSENNNAPIDLLTWLKYLHDTAINAIVIYQASFAWLHTLARLEGGVFVNYFDVRFIQISLFSSLSLPLLVFI